MKDNGKIDFWGGFFVSFWQYLGVEVWASGSCACKESAVSLEPLCQQEKTFNSNLRIVFITASFVVLERDRLPDLTVLGKCSTRIFFFF
jgi:hypothetical protein